MSAAEHLSAEVAARALLYQHLAEPFLFPTPQLCERFRSGAWQSALHGCLRQAGIDGVPIPDRLAVSSHEYQIEFIAMYEVGMGGAPCPLHSGHYSRDRMKTMEEVLRFYRFFGFKPERGPDRFPDHIVFELQFMAFLADIQQERQGRGDQLSPLLAQRDFCQRNLCAWLPRLGERLVEHTSLDFFKAVGLATRIAVAADLDNLELQVQAVQTASDGERER